ncbi:hypothetical protein AB205_0119630 [Aquarana catesbeiana]|uniref:Uncharacterized protein n=1 Tax=Aquarana catesbeiana TaxID=8400 RepID=A0A2G9QC03_AQUCT|nr:hypothetical protein AB205_0119630 [Aquarana catesbeiana]
MSGVLQYPDRTSYDVIRILSRCAPPDSIAAIVVAGCQSDTPQHRSSKAPLRFYPGPPGKPPRTTRMTTTLDHQVCPLDPQGNTNLCPGSCQSVPTSMPTTASATRDAYQCLISVPRISAMYQCPSLPSSAAYQCPSVPPISQCPAVSPIRTHLCSLSVPISATHECPSVPHISAHSQCPLIGAAVSVPVSAALSVPISERENLLIYKFF